MAVHAVVEGREGAARYQDVESGEGYGRTWVEEVEDGAAEEAEGCRTEEEDDRPS